MLNADGDTRKEDVIQWDAWWERKRITNDQLIMAINDRDVA
jgi:hypothetical protein